MPRNTGNFVGQTETEAMPKKQVRRRRRSSNTGQTAQAASSHTPATGAGHRAFVMSGALTKELIGIYRKAAAANPSLSETQVINGFLGELQPILTAVPIR